MTYADLAKMLATMKKLSPEKMADDIMVIGYDSVPREIKEIAYNDGSLIGLGKHQLFLSMI